MSQSKVYFIRAEDTGFVKIGRTAKEPIERLRDLQVGSPNNLSLLCWITEGMFNHTERSLHKRFKAQHVRGEWFRYEGDLSEFIEKCSYSDWEAAAEVVAPVPVTPPIGPVKSAADLGFMIRSYRKFAGMTQRDLADEIKCGLRWVVDIESGKERAEVGLVMRALEVLGVPLHVATPPPLTSAERMEIAAQMSKV